MQMSFSEFVSHDSLLDLKFCSPRLDTSLWLEHLLVGRWAYEMSIRTGPCLCSFAVFGFLSSPWVLGHQKIICWMEPTTLLPYFEKPPFAPNFISQHRGKMLLSKKHTVYRVPWTRSVQSYSFILFQGGEGSVSRKYRSFLWHPD